MTRVRFIGSGDSFGNGGRFQTCILVDADGYRFLIDCGATSLVALKRAGIDPGSIDAVLLTHFHGDHCGGVPYLILDGQFAKRERPLVIAGPPGVRERMTAVFEAALPTSSRTEQRFEVTYVDLGERASRIGPLEVAALPVAHLAETVPHGLRVRVDDRVVAYTGDTEWCDALPQLADGADLLIAEAYSFEKRIPQHLSHATLLAHREELRARQIVLTHAGPERSLVRRISPGPSPRTGPRSRSRSRAELRSRSPVSLDVRALSRALTLSLALLAFVTSACRSTPSETVVSPTTSAPNTSPAATEPSATPVVIATPETPVATALPSALTPAPAPITRVATSPLGDLRGGRIYALKEYATPGGTGVIRELWSSTLDGASVTTLAARIEFPSEVTVLVGRPRMALRHIFSPDGRRVVVTDGAYRLTTIDLGSGRASSLGIDGYAPTWTRDGRWIVYASLDPSADYMNPYRLWAIPADLTDRPRQILGDSVAALAGGSRIVVYDARIGAQAIVDVADGTQLGQFPDLVDSITWRSASPQYAFVRNQQQTPGGGRTDDTTSIVVTDNDVGGPRTVVQRIGSQYEVRFRDLRWNPLRDELLYSVEGISRTYGIVRISSGVESPLPSTAQYLTWAQDGEHLVGLARGDPGPRPSGLPLSLDFKRATVVVLGRDGSIARSTAISAVEPFEVLSQVVTVGYQ